MKRHGGFTAGMGAAALLLALMLGVGSASAGSGVNIDGIEFVDRVTSGEVSFPLATFGVGVIDFDGDGYMDLILGNQGGVSMQLMHNVPDVTGPGGRNFVDVTSGSGLDDTESVERRHFGFAIADVDNDGDTDVYTLGELSSDGSIGLLYLNDGSGNFTNVSVSSGLRVTGYKPECASFHDYDHDGDVDLMIANVAGSARTLLLFENQGDGTFVDVSSKTPDLGNYQAAYGMLWSDYDQDGWADCFVCVFGSPATLLRNIPDGMGGRRFQNVAQTVNFKALGFAPMGLTSGDIDNDGDIDYAVSNGAAGRYFENQGDGTLVQITPFTAIFGWGNALLDVENDGDLDYYMAGSWAAPAFDLLFRNNGDGTWDTVSTALNGIEAASRFSAQLDFDNDGRMDILTMNPGTAAQRVSLYHNVSTTDHHWFKLDLNGDGSFVARDAIGAFVKIVAGGVEQVREVNRLGSSTASTEDLRLHFGLGANTQVDRIEVLWPRAGTLATRLDIFEGPFAADQILTLEPKTAIVRCGEGTVNLASGTIEDVLTLNGSIGGAAREVAVNAGDALSGSIQMPSQGSDGRYVIHANVGMPGFGDATPLPASIGTVCFPLLIDRGGEPDAVWNNLGRASRIGSSVYFDGTPLPSPPLAPDTWLDLPVGDLVNLPVGSVVTFQGVTRDDGSVSNRRASATNAVLLRVQ